MFGAHQSMSCLLLVPFLWLMLLFLCLWLGMVFLCGSLLGVALVITIMYVLIFVFVLIVVVAAFWFGSSLNSRSSHILCCGCCCRCRCHHFVAAVLLAGVVVDVCWWCFFASTFAFEFSSLLSWCVGVFCWQTCFVLFGVVWQDNIKPTWVVTV